MKMPPLAESLRRTIAQKDLVIAELHKKFFAMKRKAESPRHTLTLRTATVPDRPRVRIERLKGGELVWQVEVTATTIGKARERAMAEAKVLLDVLAEWQEEQAKSLVPVLKRSLAAVGEKEAAP